MTRRDLDDTLSAIGLLDDRISDLYEWVVAQGSTRRARGGGSRDRDQPIPRRLHLDRLTAAGLLKAGYLRLTGKVGPGPGGLRVCTSGPTTSSP